MLSTVDKSVELARSLVRVDDWDHVPDAEVLDALRGLETLTRLVSAATVAVTAQADRRGLAPGRAYTSVRTLLRRALCVSATEAKTRERVAQAVCGAVQPGGDITPPRLPATADALQAGDISLAHARVIDTALDALPATLNPETVTSAEEFLADQARQLTPDDLRRVAHQLRCTLDQDGVLADERDAVADRELCVSRDHLGRVVFRGRLDAEAGCAFQAAIDALAAPAPAVDGQPDPRSAARRNADALVALVDRALATGDLPTDAGERPHITVTIDYQSLATEVGSATLGAGEVLTAASARRIACDARIVPVVLGSRGEPLDVGRASYVVPQPMRRALVVRDEGCAFPGCGRPPGWTDAHHVQHWSAGGETRVDNLVLLCGAHHRVIHHDGWEVRITDGQPEFVPPAWIDPDRKHRRRTRISDHAFMP